MKRFLTITFFLVAYLFSSYAQTSDGKHFMIPDIGTPGLATKIEIISEYTPNSLNPNDTLYYLNVASFYQGNSNLFTNNPNDDVRVVCMDPADYTKITFAPTCVSWEGQLVSSYIFVHEDLTPNSSDWEQLHSDYRIPIGLNVNGSTHFIDTFYILQPQPAILSTAPSIILGSGMGVGKRSPRGAMLLDSLSLTGTGQPYEVSTLDTDPNLEGNQGYLPLTIISIGDITIGPNTYLSLNANMKDAAPGGGGGGAASKRGDGGHGYTAGGYSCTPPPYDSTTVWNKSGESTGPIVPSPNTNNIGFVGSYSINGIPGGLGRCDQGGGGGTGHPLGHSGAYGEAYYAAIHNPEAYPGMYGAGSAGGEIDLPPDSTMMPFGGGGGANGSAGEMGEANYNNNGGNPTGNKFIAPICGGSGGGAGNVWSLYPGGSGGGGGGAISLYSHRSTNIGYIMANGGDGGEGYVPVPADVGIRGASGGGGGAGGSIIIGSKISHSGANNLEVAGGAAGLGDQQDTIISHDGGAGGSGRIRVDGFYQNLNNMTDSSTFGVGPTISHVSLVNPSFTLSGSGNGNNIRIYIKPKNGVWYLAGTASNYTNQSWYLPLTLDTLVNTYYVAALQENLNYNDSAFTHEPEFVLSQAATAVIYVNEPPIAFDDTLLITEDDTASIDVILNDFDPFGGTLSATILTNGSYGNATVLPNGEIQYIPVSGYYGNDTVEVIICDGVDCDTSFIFITVFEHNDPPITQNDFVITPEDIPIEINPVANDMDPDPLDLIVLHDILAGPFNGTYQILSDSTLLYTPEENFFGQDYMIYRVCNQFSYACAYDTIFITITPENDAPVAIDTISSLPSETFFTSTPEETPVTFCFEFFDIDGDMVSINDWFLPDPDGIVIDSLSLSPCITYLPDSNFNGLDSLGVIFCDNTFPSICDTLWLIIDVTPVNDPPQIIDPATQLPTDTLYEIATSKIPEIICIEAFDIDFDLVNIEQIEFLDSINNGTLSLISPGDTCFTYTSDTLFVGTDSMMVVVTDGTTTDTAIIIIDVIPYNNPPLVLNDQDSLVTLIREVTIEEVPVVICLDLFDFDNHNVQIDTAYSATGLGVLSDTTYSNPPCFTYTPNYGTLGFDTVEVIICDDGSPVQCTPILVIIEVLEQNDAPQIIHVNDISASDTVFTQTNEDETLLLCFDVFDEELNNIFIQDLTSYSISGNGSIFPTLSTTDTCVMFTPNQNYNGADTVIVYLCDDGVPSLCDSVLVIIDILPVNDPPLANNIEVMAYMNQPKEISLADNVSDIDDELSALTFFITDSANFGTNELYSSFVEYLSVKAYQGYDTLIYKVCDDDGLCDEATILVYVDYEIFLPNGFSPNNDGINDYFEILGLDNFTDAFGDPYPNKFDVFNRWGTLVFSVEDYDNNDIEKRWEGQSNTSVKRTVEGEKLPPGTYYYYFTINNGVRKSSFVILKY